MTVLMLSLARLMGQYCFARCRLSASSVVVCNAPGRSAAAGPGAWPVGQPTLHGGTVRLRPVRATPCCILRGMRFEKSWTASFMDYHPDRFFWATQFLFLVSSLFFIFGAVRSINKPFHKLLSARKYSLPSHIVSCRTERTCFRKKK